MHLNRLTLNNQYNYNENFYKMFTNTEDLD
jgi:hypothetical protein